MILQKKKETVIIPRILWEGVIYVYYISIMAMCNVQIGAGK